MWNVIKTTNIFMVLLILAALSFAYRAGSFAVSGKGPNGHRIDSIVTAHAVERVDEAPPTMKMASNDSTDIEEPLAGDNYESPYQDSGDLPFQTGFSDSEVEILQSLSKRRKNLEMREKKIAKREALLSAAESEVDQKIQELKKIRTELEKLLGKQTKVQESRLRSLVKIYESMKPKDAARIMNTLEMDVLLDVLGRMSERKSAPILANMDPARARDVTIKLAEQRQLPNIPPGVEE